MDGAVPAEPWTASAVEWNSTSAVLLRLYQVATCAQYLDGPNVLDPLMRDAKNFKPETENAIKNMRSYITAGVKAVEEYSGPNRTLLNNFPNQLEAGSFFQRAKTVLNGFCKFIIYQLIDEATPIADELSKVTPTYSHIIGDEDVNLPLAKRHIFNYPAKETLNNLTLKLSAYMTEIGRLHTQWGLSPALDVDDITKDGIAHLKGVYGAGRKVVSSIAALNIIFNLKDKDKPAQASFLLTNAKDSMPGSLKKELQSFVR